MARRTVENILDLVEGHHDATLSLRARMDTDHQLYRLNPYDAGDGYQSYTSNEPQTYADKIISWLAAADRVFMLQHAVYSVISPEGCASILWRTAEKAPDAAEAMRVTAQQLAQLNVIDRIVPEPLGGAHRDVRKAAETLGQAIGEELDMLGAKSPEDLRKMREDRFLTMAS